MNLNYYHVISCRTVITSADSKSVRAFSVPELKAWEFQRSWESFRTAYGAKNFAGLFTDQMNHYKPQSPVSWLPLASAGLKRACYVIQNALSDRLFRRSNHDRETNASMAFWIFHGENIAVFLQKKKKIESALDLPQTR